MSTGWHWKHYVPTYLNCWVDGWVVTPASKSSFNNSSGRGDKRPVIIDNGAWTRHRKKQHRDAELVYQEIQTIHDYVVGYEHPIKFCILPDVIGDWTQTIANAWKRPGDNLPWALGIQEGFTYHQVREYFQSYPTTKLFIGGDTFLFKKRAVDQLAPLANEFGIRFHIGRISAWDHMLWAARHPLVRSVDTSTFSRLGMNKGYKEERAQVLYTRLGSLNALKMFPDHQVYAWEEMDDGDDADDFPGVQIRYDW